jgi:hypothetical protein
MDDPFSGWHYESGYILAHRKERLTSRDIHHGDTTMRGLKRADHERIGYQLEALGWVTAAPGLRPTQAPVWVVNPEVHRRFEARARKEAARRGIVQGALPAPRGLHGGIAFPLRLVHPSGIEGLIVLARGPRYSASGFPA